MIANFITLHVKAEMVEAFVKATLENLSASVLEPGILRFELFQEKDKPTTFILQEIYAFEEAQSTHFQTMHFKKWREETKDMFDGESGFVQTLVRSDLAPLK